MSDKYKIAAGWNNEGSLANMLVQPATPSRLQYANRDFSADGKSTPAGSAFVDLVYTVLTNDEFPALNTQFGVTLTAPDCAVTIRLKKDNNQFANYNAWIHYPEQPQHAPVGWKATYRVNIVEAL